MIYINCVVNNFDPVSMLTIQPMVILEDDPHRRLDSWGRAVTNTLTKVRGCASNVGQMPPYLSDHAAEKANLEQAVLNKPVSYPWPRLLRACWKVEEEELRKVERRIRYTLYALFDSDHQPASLACGDSRALRGRKEEARSGGPDRAGSAN